MSPNRRGFSLIELLTVIAIISILAAIIFPVAAVARRKTLESQCMSNLYQIYTAVQMFHQDEHRYPEFFAGPVKYKYASGYTVYNIKDPSPNQSDTDPPVVVPLGESDGMLNHRVVALYPNYLKASITLACPERVLHGTAPGDFTNSPDNQYSATDTVDDPMFKYWSSLTLIGTPKSDRATGYTYTPKTGPTITVAYQLYPHSTYDSQVPPEMKNREAHFSPVWQYIDPSDYSDPKYTSWLENSHPPAYYSAQLWWRNPPSNTVITWCSFHRGMNHDLVLFLDGQAKRVDYHMNGNTAVGETTDWKLAWRYARASN